MLGGCRIVVSSLLRRVVVRRGKFRDIAKSRDLRDLVLYQRGHEQEPLSGTLEGWAVIPGGILVSKAVDHVFLLENPFVQPP